MRFAETLRRTFTTWSTTARRTRARRLRLAEREEEIRLDKLTMSWEKWRDRFCENSLREAVGYIAFAILIVFDSFWDKIGARSHHTKSKEHLAPCIFLLAVSLQRMLSTDFPV